MDELIKKTIEWTENAGNLALQEMPYFVEEVVTYGFYSNLIKFILCFIVFLLLIYPLKICYKELFEGDPLSGDGAFFVGSTVLFFQIIFLWATYYHIDLFLKSWLSPTLYILELIKR